MTPTPDRRSTRALTFRLLGATLPLLLLAACDSRFGAPEGATQEGRSIRELYQLMFYVAIAVAGTVYLLILWSLVRYRRKKDSEDLPPQFRKHIPLEVLYTIIPLLIVGWLFYETWRTERPIDDLEPGETAVTVHAVGFQWQWRFEYPDQGFSFTGTPSFEPEIWLPVGQKVHFELTAPDVIHSFYIPEFLFKRDAIPGMVNEFDLLIEEAGVYRGECAEYCGLDHLEMNFTVRGVSPAEFEDWVAEQKAEQG